MTAGHLLFQYSPLLQSLLTTLGLKGKYLKKVLKLGRGWNENAEINRWNENAEIKINYRFFTIQICCLFTIQIGCPLPFHGSNLWPFFQLISGGRFQLISVNSVTVFQPWLISVNSVTVFQLISGGRFQLISVNSANSVTVFNFATVYDT
jgi:hypothetical protein